MIDGRDMAFTEIALPRHAQCAVCGTTATTA
jgi:hypothetical protein